MCLVGRWCSVQYDEKERHPWDFSMPGWLGILIFLASGLEKEKKYLKCLSSLTDKVLFESIKTKYVSTPFQAVLGENCGDRLK